MEIERKITNEKLRILTANINGFPSKKANKHKLKAINEWKNRI